MKYKAVQGRETTSSGTTWIPLSRQLVKIIKMSSVAERLLGNRSPYAKKADGNNVNAWQKGGHGIVHRIGSSEFQVLVCKHNNISQIEDGLNNIFNQIKSSLGFISDTDIIDNVQSSSKSQGGPNINIAEMLGLESSELETLLNNARDNEVIIDDICNLLSPLIALAVIDNYSVDDKGNGCTIQTFVERHYSRRVFKKDSENTGRYTFEHTHQLVSDTSDETGNDNSVVRLRSVPIPGAPSRPISGSSLWKQIQSHPAGAELIPDAMPRTKALAKLLLENPQDPEERVVGEPDFPVYPPNAMQQVNGQDGELVTFKYSDDPEVPLETKGGAANRSANTFDNNHVGTRHGTTTSGGEADNPMSHLPSAAFLPNTTWLSSIFAGPIAFFQDPGAAFAVIGIVTLLQSDEEDEISYVQKYKTLPSMLIDNQTVDDNLFGEGAGYALGLGPTPDIGQPETQE